MVYLQTQKPQYEDKSPLVRLVEEFGFNPKMDEPYFVSMPQITQFYAQKREEDYEEYYPERIERIERTTRRQRRQIVEETKKPNKRTRRRARDNKRHKSTEN